MKPNFRILSILTAAAACVPAFAQETDIPNDDQVVQMEKFITVSTPVDRANSLLTSDLKATYSPASNALDLINALPGVSVQQGDAFGGDDWSTSISLRGFKSDRGENQLGWTIDGLPNGNTNYGGGTKVNRLIDPENTSLVTVSQGTADISSPAAQSLGGTIEYFSINPSVKAGVNSQVTIGDNDLRRVFARFNTGLLSDGATSAYVSISDQSHSRWMEEGSQGHTDRFHIDSKLQSRIGAVSIGARLSYDDIYENNYNGVTLSQFATNPEWDYLTGNWTGQPAVDQNYILGWATVRENTLAGLDFAVEPVDGLQLTARPYWHRQEGRGDWVPPYWRIGYKADGTPTGDAPFAAIQGRAFFQDAAGNPLVVGDPATAPAGVTFHTPANPFDINTYPESVRAGAKALQSFRTSLYQFDRYGVTLAGEWKIDERNTAKFGAWVETLDRDWGRTWQKVLDTTQGYEWDRNAYWTDFASNLQTDTIMLYGQDRMELGSLTLSAGLKMFLVDISYSDDYGLIPSKTFNSDSNILPSVGAVYDLGANGQMFANFTRNFSAVLDEVITRDLSASLEPETSDNIDIGYRVTRGSVTASVAAYFSQFDNRITFVTPRTVGGVTQINYDIGQGGGYVNVGGIESKGVEAALHVDVTREFGAYLSATWNQSEYSKSVPENGVVAGNEVVGSPEYLLSATGFYQRGPFRASLTGKYTGERKGTLDNSETLDAFTLWNASIGYSADLDGGIGLRRMNASLNVSNLFDKSYLAGLDGGGSVSTGYYFIGSPRTVSATIGFEF